MATSQNGWTTIAGNDLDKSNIPGTSVTPVPGLRPGDVATVLLHVGKLFNERVDRLYNPGCWGWNVPIAIPGSDVISNHGSGTAIDLNAPSFPWKLRRMTPEQREACRQIVRDLNGVVAWGGDYTTHVDEMHFEIVGNEQEVAEAAKKIKGGIVMDFADAKKAVQMVKHRDVPSEEEVKALVGLKPDEALGRLLDDEWKGQNWVLQEEYPRLNEAHKLDKAAIADKESALKEVAELRERLSGKDDADAVSTLKRIEELLKTRKEKK